jgi:hypothetical protein
MYRKNHETDSRERKEKESEEKGQRERKKIETEKEGRLIKPETKAGV